MQLRDRIFGIALTADYISHHPEFLAVNPPRMEDDFDGAGSFAVHSAIVGTLQKAREVFPGANIRYIEDRHGIKLCVMLVEAKALARTLPQTPSDEIIERVQNAIDFDEKPRWYYRAR